MKENKNELVGIDEVILRSSVRLFAKHGFEGVGIRSICEDSGCNVSAISYYFGGKDELYKTCLISKMSLIHKLAQEHLTVSSEKQIYGRNLKSFCIEFKKLISANYDFLELLQKESRECFKFSGREVLDSLKKFRGTLTTFFEHGKKNNFILQSDSATLVDFTLSYFLYGSLFYNLKDLLNSQEDTSDKDIEEWLKLVLVQ